MLEMDEDHFVLSDSIMAFSLALLLSALGARRVMLVMFWNFGWGRRVVRILLPCGMYVREVAFGVMGMGGTWEMEGTYD